MEAGRVVFIFGYAHSALGLVGYLYEQMRSAGFVAGRGRACEHRALLLVLT
jgi:hypothetical protein